MRKVFVLWIGPGHRVKTCVSVPVGWLQAYRNRVVREWKGVVLAVYRPKYTSSHSSTPRGGASK